MSFRPVAALVWVAALSACAPELGGRCADDGACGAGRCVAGTCVSDELLDAHVTDGPPTGAEAAPPPGDDGPVSGDGGPVSGDARTALDAAVDDDDGRPANDGSTTPIGDGALADVAASDGSTVLPTDGAGPPGCVPTAERCNGQDDDCDGRIDDRCTVPHGEGVCEVGECAQVVCAPGFSDQDEAAENGCERGCGPAVLGRPVGGEPPMLSSQPPAVAFGGAETALAVAAPEEADGQDGRLRFALGAGAARVVGTAGFSYNAPSLAPVGDEGFLLVARRAPPAKDPGTIAWLRLDAAGATLSESTLDTGPAAGRPFVAATRGPDGPVFLLGAIGQVRGVALVAACGRFDAADPLTPLPAEPATSALPAAFDADGRLGLAWVGASGRDVHVRLFDTGCQPLGEVVVNSNYNPTGLALAYAPSFNGVPNGWAVLAMTDAFRLTIVAIDLARPDDLTIGERFEHAGRVESNPVVVPTRSGYWVLYGDEPGTGVWGLPLSAEGRVVGEPVTVVDAAPGQQVERLRAAPHPGGIVAGWIVTPFESADPVGPVYGGVLDCE